MRETKLTDKDMSVLREGEKAEQQHKNKRGTLRDYSLKHKVTMDWDLNDDAKRDMIFRLKIDDYEVLLDWEEMMRYGRWI